MAEEEKLVKSLIFFDGPMKILWVDKSLTTMRHNEIKLLKMTNKQRGFTDNEMYSEEV